MTKKPKTEPIAERLARIERVLVQFADRLAALERRAPPPVKAAPGPQPAPAPPKREAPLSPPQAAPPVPPPVPQGRDESRHSFNVDGTPKDEAELRRDGVDPNSAFRRDGSPKTNEELMEDARHPERHRYRGPQGRQNS